MTVFDTAPYRPGLFIVRLPFLRTTGESHSVGRFFVFFFFCFLILSVLNRRRGGINNNPIPLNLYWRFTSGRVPSPDFDYPAERARPGPARYTLFVCSSFLFFSTPTRRRDGAVLGSARHPRVTQLYICAKNRFRRTAEKNFSKKRTIHVRVHHSTVPGCAKFVCFPGFPYRDIDSTDVRKQKKKIRLNRNRDIHVFWQSPDVIGAIR